MPYRVSDSCRVGLQREVVEAVEANRVKCAYRDKVFVFDFGGQVLCFQLSHRHSSYFLVKSDLDLMLFICDPKN